MQSWEWILSLLSHFKFSCFINMQRCRCLILQCLVLQEPTNCYFSLTCLCMCFNYRCPCKQLIAVQVLRNVFSCMKLRMEVFESQKFKTGLFLSVTGHQGHGWVTLQVHSQQGWDCCERGWADPEKRENCYSKQVHICSILLSPWILGIFLALIFKKLLIRKYFIFYSEEKHLHSSIFYKTNNCF